MTLIINRNIPHTNNILILLFHFSFDTLSISIFSLLNNFHFHSSRCKTNKNFEKASFHVHVQSKLLYMELCDED
jgi:hypothetical protein